MSLACPSCKLTLLWGQPDNDWNGGPAIGVLSGMEVQCSSGDLLDQDVDVIVNAWNRNPFPWWLLLPQGVSGAIKRRGGVEPFRELRRHGLLPLGGAVLTTAGRLPFQGIIHVAGIGLDWRASERSIRASARNAIELARAHDFGSIAFPLIGAGTGGISADDSERWMREVLESSAFTGTIHLVRFTRAVT